MHNMVYRKTCRRKSGRKACRRKSCCRKTYRKACRRRRSRRGGELSVNLNGDRAPLDGKRYHVSQVELYPNRLPQIVYYGEAKAHVPISAPICREDARQCETLPVTYEMDGRGILIQYDPDRTFTRYEGEFANNMKHGNGKIIMSNGTTYDGNWENDTMSGQGKISFTNSIYKEFEGDFANGVMHGKGKMLMINGDTYQGDFVDGNMHGIGKLVFQNGDTYEGDFVNGNMHGTGKLVFQNGDIFEGEFDNGQYEEEEDDEE